MYKIEFTQLEKNKFNLIENEKIRRSTMSVYMYMMKLNKKENEQYADANLNINTKEITISMAKFLKKYNRNHNKISIRTLKNRIDMLEELKLISIDNTSKCNTYSFNRYEVNEKVNGNVNDKEVVEPIENTNVKAYYQKPKYLNSKIDKKDINNSTVGTKKVFISSIEEIKEKLDYFIDKNNITSKTVIKEIYRRIKNAIKGGYMRFKGIEKYIRLTILSIKKSFIPMLTKQSKAKNNIITKKSTFTNYEQRNYDFSKLEAALLGSNENISLSECTI